MTSEIVALLQEDPDGKHMVWQQGFDGWKPASEVASIQAALSAGGPPPPPPM